MGYEYVKLGIGEAKIDLAKVKTLEIGGDPRNGVDGVEFVFTLTETADGNIAARRVCEIDSSGDIIAGTLQSQTVIGVEANDDAKVSTDSMNLVTGFCTVVAAGIIAAGSKLKCATAGKVIGLLTASKAGGTMKTTGVGKAFTNQPTNDSIEIVSGSAGDTSLSVTIIGVTGTTITVEEMTTDASDGTTPKASSKSDWDEILAVKINGTNAGTITVREASADQLIVAITAGTNKTAGVESVAAASQPAFGLIPDIKASGASTKNIGVKYIPANGSAATYKAVALNGTTEVALLAALEVTEIYTGDLEASRTAVLLTNSTEEDENNCIGTAIGGATAADDEIKAFIR